MSGLKPPTYKIRSTKLRRRAGFAPRAAREVDSNDQDLDGHGCRWSSLALKLSSNDPAVHWGSMPAFLTNAA
jgi:hypothetical protein